MFTIAAALILSGFFAFYCTSKRAVVQHEPVFMRLLKKKKGLAKIVGYLCILGGLTILFFTNGVGSGVLFCSLIIMGLGSLVVIFQPLRTVRFGLILLIFITSFCAEILC